MSQDNPRIALYGRHSTSMQTESSSRDQAAACSKMVKQLDGVVVEVYLDPEMSGYRRDRPGLQRLLADIRRGRIDMVVSESLDRLARDPEDVAWIGKKLSFDGIELHTISEGHVDEVKFAVAALLGALFLKHLIDKTIRGMQAAVLAGRFAGGRAFGYKRVIRLDAHGSLVRGLLEIDEDAAAIIRMIFAWFAGGLSSIEIAKHLNKLGIPGPRGGQWNASTIRGDPKKMVGVLNNPLYVGRLVWGRRQWRKNPDSDKRERRYRLREPSEWVEVAVPDLCIIDDEGWEAVRAELERRSRPREARSPAHANRAQYLLSGLIRCSCCGSNYTISGKDYYRCAGQKERGTCSNKTSVRKGPLETAALTILQGQLFTEDHARIFVKEYERETLRLSRADDRQDEVAEARLKQLESEIANLSANFLSGLVSPTLAAMLSDREQEKAKLVAALRAPSHVAKRPALPSPTVLTARFSEKVRQLRATLNDDLVRTQASAILATLIESVTIDVTPVFSSIWS